MAKPQPHRGPARRVLRGQWLLGALGRLPVADAGRGAHVPVPALAEHKRGPDAAVGGQLGGRGAVDVAGQRGPERDDHARGLCLLRPLGRLQSADCYRRAPQRCGTRRVRPYRPHGHLDYKEKHSEYKAHPHTRKQSWKGQCTDNETVKSVCAQFIASPLPCAPLPQHVSPLL